MDTFPGAYRLRPTGQSGRDTVWLCRGIGCVKRTTVRDNGILVSTLSSFSLKASSAEPVRLLLWSAKSAFTRDDRVNLKISVVNVSHNTVTLMALQKGSLNGERFPLCLLSVTNISAQTSTTLSPEPKTEQSDSLRPFRELKVGPGQTVPLSELSIPGAILLGETTPSARYTLVCHYSTQPPDNCMCTHDCSQKMAGCRECAEIAESDTAWTIITNSPMPEESARIIISKHFGKIIAMVPPSSP
jgi:hypothetical protein